MIKFFDENQTEAAFKQEQEDINFKEKEEFKSEFW